MAINMQGSWTASVKFVEAFEAPQRFLISSAGARQCLVMDTRRPRVATLRNPRLRAPLEPLYPDRGRIKVPPGPIPDPPPFKPMVVPLRDQTALPAQIGQVLKAPPREAPK